MQKAQASQAQQGPQSQLQSGASSPPLSHSGMHSPGAQGQGGLSPTAAPGQHPFAMSNPAALAYAAQMGMPQMNMGMGMGMGVGVNPMLQMQMNMAQPFANPHAMQSVMRNPSPGPMPVSGQNFMNLGGMQGF